MTAVPVFPVQVQSGALVWARDAFVRYVRGLADGRYLLSLKRERAQRSDAQNKYWHGVIVEMLAEHCGYDHNEMHDALKVRFLSREDPSTGLIVPGSTAKLDTAAFTLLIDSVRVWAHVDLGVYLPAPNEVEV